MDPDHDPWEKPNLFSWRVPRMLTKTNPSEEGAGLGHGKHPILLILAVWAAGIGLIVGLSYVLPPTAAGLAAIVIVVWLLLTMRP